MPILARGPYFLLMRATMPSAVRPGLDLARLAARLPHWLGAREGQVGPARPPRVELPCDPDPNPWVSLGRAPDPSAPGGWRWEVLLLVQVEVVAPDVTDDLPARAARVALWDAGLRATDGPIEFPVAALVPGRAPAIRPEPSVGFTRVETSPEPGAPGHRPRALCPTPRAAPARRPGAPPGTLAPAVSDLPEPEPVSAPPPSGSGGRRRRLAVAAAATAAAATALALSLRRRVPHAAPRG